MGREKKKPVAGAQPGEQPFLGRPSADHDFADLDHGRDIGVVRDVAQDLLAVLGHTGLERLHRVGEDVAHADIGRRRARSTAGDQASPHMSDAAVNSKTPAMNTRLRPSRSAARPPSSSRPPDVSVYPFSTQDRPVAEKCKLLWMCGSAMFTTVMSRMIMS